MSKVFSKYILQNILFILKTITIVFLITGCASRDNSPLTLDDSTIIFPSNSDDGIYTKITFSNKLSKKTGKPVKVDSVFKIRNNAKVYATIELINYKSQNQKDLLLHIDWLDSTGNSIYKKRIDFKPPDTSMNLTSSISISPGKRKDGEYKIRVYLFRELIAEKKFQIVKSYTKPASIKKKEINKKKSISKDKIQKSAKPKITTDIPKATIILCKKLSKKTGNPAGVGTTFTIKEKAKLKAIVNVEREKIKNNEQMIFYLNWKDPDGKVFYKKRIVYTSSNPNFTITNSITITPEKRLPGIYTLEVVFQKKIIAEQNFELIVQTK